MGRLASALEDVCEWISRQWRRWRGKSRYEVASPDREDGVASASGGGGGGNGATALKVCILVEIEGGERRRKKKRKGSKQGLESSSLGPRPGRRAESSRKYSVCIFVGERKEEA